MKFDNISNYQPSEEELETYEYPENGTSLQGHVNIKYHELVGLFGEPSDGDGYKVQKEWVLRFEDGTVATIYDWKWGDDYNGEGNGTYYTEVPEWNIGGHNINAVHCVLDVIKHGVDNDAIEGEVIINSLPYNPV